MVKRTMMNPDSVAAMLNAAKLLAHAEKCAERREWKTADELFRQAISSDTSPRSRIAYGVCLAAQERYFESISAFMPIMEGTDRQAIGIVCHNLAAIYRDIGDFDLARRFQWRATLLQDESTLEDLVGLANDALISDHTDVAESLISAACEMDGEDFEGSADGDLIATAGLVKAKSGLTREGLYVLFAAYRRHRSIQDFRGMGFDLMNMAMLLGELNRHQAKKICLLRAIDCFQQAGAPQSRERAGQQLDQLGQMHAVRLFDVRRN
jgi:tetratricopeptide (TPR) repeat protein